MDKPFALGILVGRFQTLHAGHQQMIETALSLCDQVGIFVGSSQESGTQKNPFPYALRKRMLEKLFGDRVGVYPLPDIGVGNTAAWGDYVLENVMQRFGRMPDLLVSGKETRRLDWFRMAFSSVLRAMRPLPFSAAFSDWRRSKNATNGIAQASSRRYPLLLAMLWVIAKSSAPV